MKLVELKGSMCFAILFCFVLSLTIAAQVNNNVEQKGREKLAQVKANSNQVETPKTGVGTDESDKNEEIILSEDKTAVVTSADAKSDDDDDTFVNFYNNYLKEYQLGPEDVITVRVFGQCPDYCRENLTIPPTARISYPLIRGGINVGGMSIPQLEDEITKQLNEYIIDPDVTVELVKVGSARYSVLGRVTSPGIHLMTRKISIFDAIAESNGILKEGEKKKVMIFRRNKDEKMDQILVNLKDIEDGKTEMAYLEPGDQVFVPKEGFKLTGDKILDIINKVSVFRLLFGGF